MKRTILLLLGLFLYSAAARAQTPSISSISPAIGAPGTLVTVNGTNLSSPANFTIGGQSAIITSNTGSTIVAMVMPGAITGNAAITTAAGTAQGGVFTVTAT